jgi:hypothetical protein
MKVLQIFSIYFHNSFIIIGNLSENHSTSSGMFFMKHFQHIILTILHSNHLNLHLIHSECYSLNVSLFLFSVLAPLSLLLFLSLSHPLHLYLCIYYTLKLNQLNKDCTRRKVRIPTLSVFGRSYQ